MNLALNLNPASAPAPAPDVAVAAPIDAAGLFAQLLPFPQVIAADAVLPEAAPATADALPLPDTATDDTGSPDAAADAAATPDMLFGAMAAPVTPVAMPAVMMAMPAPKPAPADAAPVDEMPTLAAAAPRSVPEATLAPVPARADTPVLKPVTVADAPASDTAPSDTTSPAPGINGAATQPAAPRGADRLPLAGPPTAWRQTLHEALGERVQLQMQRGSEQATIRLDPPMLGRIEIAIRHSGGNLEVQIAASNGEVLRQLNAVSDSLRGDLAGRQYASVSVSVSATGETARTQASAQAGGHQPSQGDAQGRRQSGEEQQQQQQQRTPGLALNDAGPAGSLFSLNGRD